MEKDIEQAFQEFKDIDEPRGDIQGICEARAMQILKKYNPEFKSSDYMTVMEVSDLILQKIDEYHEQINPF